MDYFRVANKILIPSICPTSCVEIRSRGNEILEAMILGPKGRHGVGFISRCQAKPLAKSDCNDRRLFEVVKTMEAERWNESGRIHAPRNIIMPTEAAETLRNFYADIERLLSSSSYHKGGRILVF